MIRTLTRLAWLPLLLTACSKDSDQDASESDDETTIQPASASAASRPSAAKPQREENEEGPRTKAFESPAESDLGQLPEGVGVLPGEPAPDATVRDLEGKAVELSDLYEEQPVVLVFYRGGWCPYCNFQVRSLGQAYEEFDERGVMPVAISVDQVSEAAKTKKAHALKFPVLSDPKLEAHRAFRVLNEVDDSTLERLQSFGIDLEKSSGQEHHTIAVPAIFVIDEGKVRWAHADRDYKKRPKTAQILEVLDELGYEADAEE